MGTWEYTPGKGEKKKNIWTKPSFSGSILIFGVCGFQHSLRNLDKYFPHGQQQQQQQQNKTVGVFLGRFD